MPGRKSDWLGFQQRGNLRGDVLFLDDDLIVVGIEPRIRHQHEAFVAALVAP